MPFDPSLDTFTYSNGDRTITGRTADAGSFVQNAVAYDGGTKFSGKWYFEIAFDVRDTSNANTFYIGLTQPTNDPNANITGNPKNYLRSTTSTGTPSLFYWPPGGTIVYYQDTLSINSGDIWGFAYDFDYAPGQFAVYLRHNGTWIDDPAVGSPALIGDHDQHPDGFVPYINYYQNHATLATMAQFTAAFLDTDQTGSMPAGYNSWEAAPFVAEELETAELNDYATPLVVVPLLDSAELNDYLTVTYIRAIAVLRESAGFADSAAVSKTVGVTARETAEFRDRAVATLRFNHTLTESAVVTDAVTPGQTPVTARETAAFNDRAVVTRTLALTLRESAAFNDRAVAVALVTLSEEALIADYVYPARFIRETARETAGVTSTATVISQQHAAQALEVAQLADYVTPQLDTYPSVNDEAFISDALYLDDVDDGYIWTAPITTWAMSRYVGTPFTSMVDDFAATNDALFIKDGGFGDADVVTGDDELGSDHLKRVRALHMYGEHTVPLTVSVTADVQGARSTNSYTQMARDASDDRAVRCTLGRGYRSQHYQIGLQSEGYARIREIVPLVDSALRRV